MTVKTVKIESIWKVIDSVSGNNGYQRDALIVDALQDRMVIDSVWFDHYDEIKGVLDYRQHQANVADNDVCRQARNACDEFYQDIGSTRERMKYLATFGMDIETIQDFES